MKFVKTLFVVLFLLVLQSSGFAQIPKFIILPGWNMIGGTSVSITTCLIDTLEAVIPPIYTFNPSSGVYEEVDTINPLMGYWVLSTDTVNFGDDCDCVASVTDIDGNTYETVLIGSQCWMAENLRVGTYRDGTPIIFVTDTTQWKEHNITETGAYGVYDNDILHSDALGLLYNWYVVDNECELCPEGWRVPDDDDWRQLELNLGMSEASADSTGIRGSNEASKMAERYSLWLAGELRCDSGLGKSGFSVVPAGYRYSNGEYCKIFNLAHFWSSSEFSSSLAWSRKLSYNSSKVNWNKRSKHFGFSVRCIRN